MSDPDATYFLSLDVHPTSHLVVAFSPGFRHCLNAPPTSDISKLRRVSRCRIKHRISTELFRAANGRIFNFSLPTCNRTDAHYLHSHSGSVERRQERTPLLGLRYYRRRGVADSGPGFFSPVVQTESRRVSDSRSVKQSRSTNKKPLHLGLILCVTSSFKLKRFFRHENWTTGQLLFIYVFIYLFVYFSTTGNNSSRRPGSRLVYTAFALACPQALRLVLRAARAGNWSESRETRGKGVVIIRPSFSAR